MTADAVVISTRADGFVDLEFSSARQCAACAGTCLWKRLQAAHLNRLPVSQAFEPGSPVSVALPARRVLLASILLHGLPLLAILAGAALGAWSTGSDGGTLIGALLALAVVVGGFSFWRRRIEQATFASLIVTPRS